MHLIIPSGPRPTKNRMPDPLENQSVDDGLDEFFGSRENFRRFEEIFLTVEHLRGRPKIINRKIGMFVEVEVGAACCMAGFFGSGFFVRQRSGVLMWGREDRSINRVLAPLF